MSRERDEDFAQDSVARFDMCDAAEARLRFLGGSTYVYDRGELGLVHVERMKALPSVGRGLSAYISRCVRDAYCGGRRSGGYAQLIAPPHYPALGSGRQLPSRRRRGEHQHTTRHPVAIRQAGDRLFSS